MDFESQYFENLEKSIEGLGKKMEGMDKKISDIQSKVIYMYAFAAGIGFAVSFTFEWLKSMVTNPK